LVRGVAFLESDRRDTHGGGDPVHGTSEIARRSITDGGARIADQQYERKQFIDIHQIAVIRSKRII